MIDWNAVSPENFEKLCCEILTLNEFSNIKWYGKGGGDKGRDILASKIEEPLPHVKESKTWLIQCKRYISSSLGKKEIDEIFTDAKEHSPDYLLIMTCGSLTSNTKDWFNSVKVKQDFLSYVWEQVDLEREVSKHQAKLSQQFSFIPKRGQAARFYHMPTGGTTYYCNEIEEVGFHILNRYEQGCEVKMINDFIQFIRENEIVFDEDTEL